MLSAIAFALVAICLLGATASAAVQTPEQLQAMFDQGQYSQLLPLLNQAIADKTTVADPATKYKLLMLKGETLLHEKAKSSAQDAFRTAASLPTDAKSEAIARATVSLLKRSSVSTYQPKTKDGGATKPADPIDILSPDSRKQAFTALFTDMLEPVNPVVAAAEKATSLPPILAVLPRLTELRDIELAGTDSDDQSKELLHGLATHAASLMSASLKSLDENVTTIGKQATRTVKGRYGASTMTSGLSQANEQKLSDIVSEAREVADAADQLADRFADTDDFKTIKTSAEKVVAGGNALLEKNHRPAE